MKKALLLMLLLACNAMAYQRTLVVPVRDGQADLTVLNKLLSEGWRVVSATPLQASNSYSMVGKPQQAYTASIVYVLSSKGDGYGE